MNTDQPTAGHDAPQATPPGTIIHHEIPRFTPGQHSHEARPSDPVAHCAETIGEHNRTVGHERLLPEGIHEPVAGLYAQMIKVRQGDHYEIAGTLPYHPDGTLDAAMADQARTIMQNIDRCLRSADLIPSDVTRIRIYTLGMDEFLRNGSMDIVFSYFGDERPTSTLVQVDRLANPFILLEIDLTAIRPYQNGENA